MNLREEPPAQFTLHQAADALNASATYVKALLAEGHVAHHGEGARLRLDRDSLLAFQARDDRQRQAVLDELARESQEQGHGYSQDRTGQPDQAPNAAPKPEAYTDERVEEFLAEDATPPDLRARAEARAKRKPNRD